jgi:hypothetical protein
MRHAALLFAALFSGTAQAQQAQQFDLLCTSAGADTKGGAFKAEDVHLRVDLAKKLWCEEPPPEYAQMRPCASPKPIAEVKPDQIWFEKATAEEDVRGRLHARVVDRSTGEYMYVHDFPILNRIDHVAIVSRCEPAPFSGFPEPKTKF